MLRIIMHGCNGRMGQAITRIVKEDNDIQPGLQPQGAYDRGGNQSQEICIGSPKGC